MSNEKKTSLDNRFVGEAQVFDETLFIDTNDNRTLDLLIQKMRGTICDFANEFYIKGQSKEDLKQEIAIMIITGTRNYIPGTAKLSTFLVSHIHNKLLTIVGWCNKISHDATAFKPAKGKKRRKARAEVLFSELENRTLDNREGGRCYKPVTDSISEDNAMFTANRTVDSMAAFDFKRGVDRLLVSRGFDADMAKMISTIVNGNVLLSEIPFDGHERWNVAVNLRNLTRHKRIRDLFGR